MKKLFLVSALLACFVLLAEGLVAQVVISESASPIADPSSILDVQSASKGFLFPRLTQSQRNSIPAPATGLIIFQTDNTPGFYYNTGTPASANWERITDASTIGGYWSPDGSNIYFNTGNVGVGVASPLSDFHVDGAARFENDSVYITGRPGKIFLNAETSYDPVIRFASAGTSLVKLHVLGASGSNPYIAVGSSYGAIVWGMRPTGRVWHDYQGTSAAAYVLRSSAPHPSLSIENTNSTITNISHGIQVTMPNVPTTLLTTVPAGITVFIEGDGTSVYAENQNHLNKGWLATENTGASGEHGNGHRGSLGTSSSGAYGEHSDGHFGRLGYDDAGVFGNINVTTNYDGDYGVKGYGVNDSDDDGSSFQYNETRGGVFGSNYVAAEYTFGVAGYSPSGTSQTRRGGVIGADLGANYWGALGYLRSSGSSWCAGYFSAAPVTGGSNGNKNTTSPISSMAISAYGDLFGAHINGGIYGLYSAGKDYSIYAEGDMYRTGADVHLQEKNGENNVMYTLVSPEMTIQTYGVGQLVNGKATIQFDAAFANVVSDKEPIVITITPIGESEGVHLEQIDANGFRVAENNSGKSSVQFSWIAIGKRDGYENISLPADVTSADYTNKIEQGLSNDGNPDETAGKGLYYQNGKLHLGNAPGQAVGTLNIEGKRSATEPVENSVGEMQEKR